MHPHPTRVCIQIRVWPLWALERVLESSEGNLWEVPLSPGPKLRLVGAMNKLVDLSRRSSVGLQIVGLEFIVGQYVGSGKKIHFGKRNNNLNCSGQCYGPTQQPAAHYSLEGVDNDGVDNEYMY